MEHVHLAAIAQKVRVFISLAEGWMLESELVYKCMHTGVFVCCNDWIIAMSAIKIIASGVLVSTCLLLSITGKIYKLCRISSLPDNRQNPSHIPDDDNIYADITEFSQATS